MRTVLREIGIGRERHERTLQHFEDLKAAHSRATRLINELQDAGGEYGLDIMPRFWNERVNGSQLSRRDHLLERSGPVFREAYQNLKSARRREFREVYLERRERVLREEIPGLTETSEGRYSTDDLVSEAWRRARLYWNEGLDANSLTRALEADDYRTNHSLMRTGRILRTIAQTRPHEMSPALMRFVQRFNKRVTAEDIARLPEERLRRELEKEIFGSVDGWEKSGEVILRLFQRNKVSFGSQSEAGARTRSAIMTVLFTGKKRLPPDVALEDWLKETLDQIAQNPKLNIWDLLPPERAPNPTNN